MNSLNRVEKIIQAIKFLAIFLLIFTVLYSSINFYLISVELIYSNTSASILELLGFKGSITVKESLNSVWIVFPSIIIQISFLCSGLIELFVLISAVLASINTKLEKRVIGVLWSLPTIFVFNNARIVITSLILFNSSLEFADLAHNFLFRASLLIVIVGFYWIWFYWAEKGSLPLISKEYKLNEKN